MSAESEINVLRGEPIKIMIGKEEKTVLKLSIDDQIKVMDMIMDGGESTNKFAIDRMVKILLLCVNDESITRDSFSSAAQILRGFNAIWIQNEFDFLLQEVGKLKAK